MNKEEQFRNQFEKDLIDVVDRMIKYKEARENREFKETVEELVNFLSKPFFGNLSKAEKEALIVKNSDIIGIQFFRLCIFLSENKNAK